MFSYGHSKQVSLYLSLEPVLEAFMLAKLDLGGEEDELVLHVWGEPGDDELTRRPHHHQLLDT